MKHAVGDVHINKWLNSKMKYEIQNSVNYIYYGSPSQLVADGLDMYSVSCPISDLSQT